MGDDDERSVRGQFQFDSPELCVAVYSDRRCVFQLFVRVSVFQTVRVVVSSDLRVLRLAMSVAVQVVLSEKDARRTNAQTVGTGLDVVSNDVGPERSADVIRVESDVTAVNVVGC